MNQERYEFSANHNYLNFEFESDGPNGKIKKVVRFSPENVGGTTFFNLNEIETIVDIYGLNKGNWEQFRKNVNYEAFLACRKKQE